MANIDDFKANLIGGGARANQFRVTITPPPGIAIGLDVRRASFLVTASQLPASALGEIPVPFRGRNIYVTGDRPAPEPWSTTFFNDTDFMVRNAMERWHNGINNFATNTGLANMNDYISDVVVEQLNKAGEVTKKYDFRGCWPSSISTIDLNYDSENTIEEFTVEFQVQYWESDTTS